MRLHAVATILTRPDKSKHNLGELTTRWRDRAAGQVPEDEQIAWVSSLSSRNDLPLLGRDDLAEPILADAAEAVIATVAERHSTFGRLNLLAEAHRMLHGVRFASPDDRVAVAEQITELALARSVLLTPPELHHTPERYLRPDGSSRLRPRNHLVYSTATLIDAESRLLEVSREVGGPRVSVAIVTAVVEENLPGRAYDLSMDQALAVEKIATSGRMLEVLVGPAGTGKSTAMAGLRAAWEKAHGPGSVIGLAPSAAAAQVLADELGIETENTAKWLFERRRVPELTARRKRLALNLARNGYPSSAGAAKLRAQLAATDQAIADRRLKPGQLVMIDEATLAGTLSLDEIVSAARQAGSKVLLLGDAGQNGSVEAGGAFSLLVRDRGELVPELTDVRRFRSDWEKAASVELRRGNRSAIDSYQAHDRITGGERKDLLDALYAAWKADVAAGKSSLMIATDAATVAELNRRARTDRVAAGTVAQDGLSIAGGQIAGVGDEIVTRQNNRMLSAGRTWVKNGDRFAVASTNVDGTMTVRRSGGSEVVLPADYVAQHVELAYSTTAFRAQGRTVDTSHAMISPTTTREVLYVSASRGRDSNRLYVDTAYDPDPATSHNGAVEFHSPREVLVGVLANEGAQRSALEIIEGAQGQAEDFATLVAEYETIAQVAQQQRFDELLSRSGLGAGLLEQLRQSDRYGPLLARLRYADARGLDMERAFPKLVAARPFDDAEDPAAVMHGLVQHWLQTAIPTRPAASNFIAGLIPAAIGVTDPDMARALDERGEAMKRRAKALGGHAVSEDQTWVRRLGPVPADGTRRHQWIEALTTIAAYRDRWDLGNDPRPLGPDVGVEQMEARAHRKLAEIAVSRMHRLSNEDHGRREGQLASEQTVPGPKLSSGIDL
jgi:hypothetical protein